MTSRQSDDTPRPADANVNARQKIICQNLKGAGAGKSGGGSVRVPQEQPNTLQSKAIARFIDLWCEGPIKGPVAGPQSLYFDDTPLQNTDGSYNFQGVTFDWRLGTPDQDPVEGFPSVESEVAVGTEVVRMTATKKIDLANINLANNSITYVAHGYNTGDGPYQLMTSDSLSGTGFAENTNYWVHKVSNDVFKLASSSANATSGPFVDWLAKGKGVHQIGIPSLGVVRQLINPELDYAKVLMRFPALSFQDPATGDLKETFVDFNIEVQPNGGSYAPILNSYLWSDVAIPTSGFPTTPANTIAIEVTARYKPSPVVDAVEHWSIRVEYRAVGSSTWLTLGEDYGKVIVDYGASRSKDSDQVSKTERLVSRTFNISSLASDDYEIQVVKFAAPKQGTSGTSLPPGTVSIVKVRAFSLAGFIRVAGKNTSPYEEQYRVPLPAGGAPWNIRVSRKTADSAEVNRQNGTVWSSYTEGIEAKLIYPDTAYAAVGVDSQLFGGSAPRRGYELDLRLVQIPSNYDPDTRTYTGIWDGTFITAYTNNPAWVLYDILTNKRFGLGQRILSSQIDKFGLYVIGQYCDELVPDGEGGMEPRFTCNCLLQSAEDAYAVLQTIASCFRGMVYWAAGAVIAAQDSPAAAKKLVTNANVIDGNFSYAGSGLKARHSVAYVSFNDPQDGYRLAVEPYEDAALIRKIGVKPVPRLAFGCTSRSQARRFGKWIIETEKTEKEIVTYRCSWDQSNLLPGDVIDIADKNYAGARVGGRLAGVSGASVTLDAAVVLTAGNVYELSVVQADGVLDTQTVTNGPGTYTTLTVAAPYDATENLIAFPYALDDADWSKTGVTISANAALAANKQLTADKIQETAVTSEHTVSDSKSKAATAMKCYAQADFKAAERGYAGLVLFDNGGVDGVVCRLNLSTGSILGFFPFGTGWTDGAGTVENMGDGIWRLRISATSGASATVGVALQVRQDASGSATYLGVAGSGIYASNVQLWTRKPPLANGVWILRSSALQPRPFRVLSRVEVEQNIFQITATQHDPTKYARVEQSVDLPTDPYTLLQRGPLLPPEQLTYKEYLYRVGPAVKTAVTISWNPSRDTRQFQYEVQVRRANTLGYYTVDLTSNLSKDVLDTQEGSWGFRVRARPAFGTASDWVTLDPVTLVGVTAPPADVTNLRIAVIGGVAELSWDEVPDLDLDHYVVKYTTLGSGANWGSAVLLKEHVHSMGTVTVPAMVGSYLVKAVDTSGVESINAAVIVSNIAELANLNAIETYTEHPAWRGTRAGTAVNAGALVLDSSTVLDDWAAMSDIGTLLYGFAGMVSDGTYTLPNTLDLGAVYTSKVTCQIEMDGLNLLFVMSGWVPLSSAVPLSGTDPKDYSVRIQVRTTNDDPNGVPTWSAWQDFIVGEYTARAMQFRLLLHGNQAWVSPSVTLFIVTVDMPDKIQAQENLLHTAPGPQVVLHPRAFKAKPVTLATILDAQTGDYWVLSSESRTGFSITIYDKTNTPVSRYFSYHSVGYGTEMT